ncbi:carboxypeptidase-like regulatory domain-containing protein [uncultured Fibrella sp.]|uniref:carboxypeptidase-like regulatory domain-containing protein n=1 Tax=uncultured Fibrella sp. TaxID=1284596 RepID=UPI0035CB52BA
MPLSEKTVYFLRILCAFVVGLFAPFALKAQNDVQINISVLPPYSAYIQDYAGAGKQVQIFVRNATANRLNVRLQGSVTGDNGVQIQTVSNYRPPVPLTLEPFQNRLLTYADLSGLFDLSQLDVQGLDRANLYKGLPLPEGSYQLCIRAFDNATSRPLSPENPLGCSPPFPIKAVEPPILIAPFCDSDVQPLTPQNIVFTWTPPIGVSPAMVDYTLRIVELPLATSDPNVFIDAVVLPKSGIEVKGLKTSTFLYSVVQPQLIPGKKYAWRVQARDISGKTNFLNDGKSPVCSFQYGVVLQAISRPEPTYDFMSFITPAAPKGKALPVVPLGKGTPLYISWQLDPKLALAVAGKLPADPAAQMALLKGMTPAELAKAKQTDLSASSLSYKLTLTKLPQGQKKGGVVLSQAVKTPFFTAERKDLPDILEVGRTYRATLDLLGLTDEQRTQYGLPKGPISAEPRSFSLSKQNVGAESDSVVVRGTLAFRYPGEAGAAHVLPGTSVMVREISPNGYEGTIMVGRTDASGNFRVAIPREFINAVDTIVGKPISQKGKGDAPVADTTYSYTRYRIVPGNGYLIQPDQTFQLSDKQVGDFQMGTVVALARGYRLTLTARQAYKNWPDAPNVNLEGKTLIVFRKPNAYTQKEWLPVEGNFDQMPALQKAAMDNTVKAGNAGKTAVTGGSAKAAAASTNVAKTTQADYTGKVATPTKEAKGGKVGKSAATGAGTSQNAASVGNLADIEPSYSVPGSGGDWSDKASPVVKSALKELKAAGYTFIGAGVLKLDGNAYKTSIDRLLYRYISSDGYGIYCPDCGQTPDADGFSIGAPKEALSPALARTENYTVNMTTTVPPTVTFTGKLAYAFAGSGFNAANKKPMGNTRIWLQVVYRDTHVTGSKFTTDVPQPYYEFHQKISPTLATTVTSSDGSFAFAAKMTKDLVLGDLPATEPSGTGEFKVASTVYQRALRVVVDNPYFASPVETFGDKPGQQLKPLQTYDFGDVTARVKSYTLQAQIKSDTTGLSQVLKQQAGVRQELSGVVVYALRAYRKGSFPMAPYTGPPLDEGQGLTEKRAFGNNPYQYIVVAKEKTNAEGKVSFARMVMAQGEDDAYLLAVEPSPDGLNNYKLSPQTTLLTEGWGPTYTITPTPEQKAQAEKLGKVIKGMQQINCTAVLYASKPACKGCLNSEILGPLDQATAEAYKQSPFKELGYNVYTKDEGCENATGYWIGDKLKTTKVNAKVVMGGTVTPIFADNYANFSSDLVERYLVPGPPVVRVRVVDKTNPTQGINAATVELKVHSLFGAVSMHKANADPNGWVTIQPGVLKNAFLSIAAPGYVFDSYSDKDAGAALPPAKDATIELGDLNLGQNAYFPRILMQPNTRIIGSTLDADALAENPNASPKPSVEAYVQVDDGFYFKTYSLFGKQGFTVYGPGNKVDSLKIFPVNISYFNEYRLVKNLPKPAPDPSQPDGFVIKAGEIPIFQRDHRLLFDIRTQSNTKLAGAYVRLFGRDEAGYKFGPSEAIGSLEVKFKNVSVENLFVEVSRPGYVTKIISVTNTESKTVKSQTIVYLDEANLIKGNVVAKAADGTETPLKGAEVFVDMGANAQTPVSTTTNASGAFTLSVPKGLKTVNVQATYAEPGFTSLGVGGSTGGTLNGQPVAINTNVVTGPGQSYVGVSVAQSLPQTTGQSLKLTLQPFSKFRIATIWGFPVKVETLKEVSKGQVEVSGEVELSGSERGPFAIMDPTVRVRFEKVLFKPSAADATLGEPVDNTVTLKTGILDQLGYFDKVYKPGQVPRYNVKLTATEGSYNTGMFKIVRKEGSALGVVYAKAQLIDNSFNFSENLFSYQKGQFYLCDLDNRRGNNVEVVAFNAGAVPMKRTNFGLSQANGKPLEMKLLAFTATSSVEGSRLKGDEIHLNPTLTCTIKDAVPENVSVTVGNLVLKNNTIDAKSGDTPLSFKLGGNWSVEVRNWTLDYKQGGFYSTEGVVKTGKVDVPISLFNLRADFLKLEAAPAKTLELAGIAKLNVKGKAFFGYDAATGSDMKGHWSVVVTPNVGGQTAASLGADSGLPGLTSSLDFETISLLDNGEDVLTFGAASKEFAFFDNVIQVRPKTIETGKDYFAFDAGMSTSIPNAPKDRQVRFVYYRPGGKGDVALKTVMIDEFKIDTKGQVAFQAVRDVAPDKSEKMALYLANGLLVMRGFVEEPGKLKLGDAKGGMMLLHSVRPGGGTYITHDRDVDLNSPLSPDFDKLLVAVPIKNNAFKAKPLAVELGSKRFAKVYAEQIVKDGQWNLLQFSGIPTGFTMLPAEEVNRMSFTNYGAVRAEGQKIKADGLGKTEGKDGKEGFSGLSLEFDMANSRLTGSLQLPPNMPLPPTMTVEQGMAQVVIDPAGFYLAASATVRDVPLIIPVTMKAGLMLGFYTSSNFKDAEPILFQNTHRKALPCAFDTGFKGVFVNGQIPIPLIDNFSYEQSFVVGNVKMGLNGYIDGYSFANYDNGAFKFGAGLGAGVHYYAYGSVLNIAASGSVDVDGAVQAELSYDVPSKTVGMAFDMKLSAEFKAKLYVDLGIDSYSTDQEIGFCLGMGIPNVSYQIGGGVNIASPKFTCDFNACKAEICKTVTPAQ